MRLVWRSYSCSAKSSRHFTLAAFVHFFPPPRGVLAAPVPFLPAGEEPLLRTRCYFQNKEGAGAVATLGEGMLAALNFQISQRPALPGISNAELALRSRYRKALFFFFPFFWGFVSVPPSHT